jgi:hypothetical protein
MEEDVMFFSEGTLNAINSTNEYLQEVLIWPFLGLAVAATLLATYKNMNSREGGVQAAIPYIRIGIIAALFASYSMWSNELKDLLFYTTESIKEGVSGKRLEEFKAANSGLSPMEKYVLVAGDNVLSNEARKLAKENQIKEEESKKGKERDEEKIARLKKELEQLEGKDMGWFEASVTSLTMRLFSWLMDGIFYIAKLVIDQVVRILLAVVLITGLLALCMELIQKGTLANWATWLYSVMMWRLAVVLLDIFYEIKFIEDVNNFVENGKAENIILDYITTGIVFVLMYFSVPVIVGIWSIKSQGAQYFSKVIGMATLATKAVTSAGGAAAGAFGGGTMAGAGLSKVTQAGGLMKYALGGAGKALGQKLAEGGLGSARMREAQNDYN